jgi:haloacetate dehalogenase
MTGTIAGFVRARLPGDGVALSVQRAGAGAPLVLLHGYPENGLCWHRVAPALAQRFDVIVPDLRGYGASDAPPDDAAHRTYAKRQMARDVVALLDALGIGAAHVLGHDRGARVAYRLALDHPGRVRRLGIVEIATTADYWANWGHGLGMAAWHWTFLAQPAPLPERMIGADPVGWLDGVLAGWTAARSLAPFAPGQLMSYRAQMSDPARRHAMCADYRAGAGPDREDDEADRAAGHKIAAPLHFLWSRHGFPARTGDPAALWRAWAPQVTDSACDCGHFVPEEDPQAVLQAYLPFFGQAAS